MRVRSNTPLKEIRGMPLTVFFSSVPVILYWFVLMEGLCVPMSLNVLRVVFYLLLCFVCYCFLKHGVFDVCWCLNNQWKTPS